MKFKKFIALLLSISVFVSTSSTVSYASQTEKRVVPSVDTYTDYVQEYTIERIIDNDSVTVYVKTVDGVLMHTLKADKNIMRIDGSAIPSEFTKPLLEENQQLTERAAIKWGQWQESSDTLSTGGLTTALIAGGIALIAPWMSVKAAATAAGIIAGKYDEVEIKWKTRYGNDGNYYYYERQTTIEGDGKRVYGPFKDSGKERL